MERTVPSTASEEIDLYLRTAYSLLRSSSDVAIRTLEEVHISMNSSLHPDARKPSPDTSAFIYALLRMPDCMPEVQTVVLGQSSQVFSQHGYDCVECWHLVAARARRRKCYFNDVDTLACFIASRSDIDDVIPVLTAFQIEWNKMYSLLQRYTPEQLSKILECVEQAVVTLAKDLNMSSDDWERLWAIWGDNFAGMVKKIAAQRCNLRIRLLSGSLSEYWRATRIWWDNIEETCPEVLERPVYFISSNPHSIANSLSGFAQLKEDTLIKFLEQRKHTKLLAEWHDIQKNQNISNRENFLYYVLKKAQQTAEYAYLAEEQLEHEIKRGIIRIPSKHAFDVEAQVIDLNKINPREADTRLAIENWDLLKKTDAVILNIDYPLGLSAYNILSMISEHTGSIQGIYIMGKAATLNGVIGDVMIPSVVHDEHSQNTYLFQNAFTAESVTPYLTQGSALDNQKAVCVLGTFLQNSRVMDVIYREGYTDIEMEAGPYLSTVYEMSRPKRHPVNEIVNLTGLSFDIGIIHYASDTPMSKGKNLGAGTLSYAGVDSTYAATIAILRRICRLEQKRLQPSA